MCDLVGELGRDETGTLAGESATALVREGFWAGPGEGHSGLLVARDGAVLSGFVSSGMSGSGKKPVPGDLTSSTCKKSKQQKTKKLRIWPN